MKGTAFSPGQMAEFTTTVNVALAVALPKVAAKFGDPKAVLAGTKDKTEVLAGRLESAIEEVVKSMMALIRRPQLSITITDSDHRNPDAFFTTRDGLYVWDDFGSRVVKKAKPVDTGATFKVNVDELGADLTDEEIENGLPKNHVWDEGALCAVIAEMISKQPEGKEGDLLNNGYANLFYTSSCVVRVLWSAGRRGWDVDAWRRDDASGGALALGSSLPPTDPWHLCRAKRDVILVPFGTLCLGYGDFLLVYCD